MGNQQNALVDKNLESVLEKEKIYGFTNVDNLIMIRITIFVMLTQ